MSIKYEKTLRFGITYINKVAYYSMFKRPLNFKNTVDVHVQQAVQVNTSESSHKSIDHVHGSQSTNSRLNEDRTKKNFIDIYFSSFFTCTCKYDMFRQGVPKRYNPTSKM